MAKHKLIVLTCFLLVIGIIESICAVKGLDPEDIDGFEDAIYPVRPEV